MLLNGYLKKIYTKSAKTTNMVILMQEINEILKIEKDAEDLVLKAQKKLEQDLSKIREKQNFSTIQRKQKIEAQNELLIKEHVEKLEKEQEKVQQQSERKVKILYQFVEKNIEKAQDIVLKMALE